MKDLKKCCVEKVEYVILVGNCICDRINLYEEKQ